jgi:signal transduction histidine kinase
MTFISLYKKKQENFKKELELVKVYFDKELLKTQLEIQEQTFRHISLELHDNIGHFISLAKLYLTTAPRSDIKQLNDTINESVSLLGSSLEEIRKLAINLNTENIVNNGLIKTVQLLIKQIEKSGRFNVNFQITGKTCYIDDQKEIVLFRIVQEAFNNIIRHSNANLITILFHFNESKLTLTIKDNGLGFNVEEILNRKSVIISNGLQNIIKRAELINATLQILSKQTLGTTIIITTPY